MVSNTLLTNLEALTFVYESNHPFATNFDFCFLCCSNICKSSQDKHQNFFICVLVLPAPKGVQPALKLLWKACTLQNQYNYSISSVITQVPIPSPLLTCCSSPSNSLFIIFNFLILQNINNDLRKFSYNEQCSLLA